MSAAEFFQDFFTTAWRPDELLVEVRVPKHTGWGAHYEKFNRVAQAWSIVGVAATVRADGGTIEEARVALTNMAATPVRATGVSRTRWSEPRPRPTRSARRRRTRRRAPIRPPTATPTANTAGTWPRY